MGWDDYDKRKDLEPRSSKKRSAWPWIVGVAVVMIGTGTCIMLRDKQTCADRGMAYFKEIGSFPTLSNGRDATSEVMDRCLANDKAFGPWP